MTKTIISHVFKKESAQQFIDSVDFNNSYYVTVGNHLDYSTEEIPTPTDSQNNLLSNTYANMIFGKRITPADVNIMAKRYNWESNTVYTMYEHDNNNLYSNNFYVTVDEGSFYHIFKCLFNNNGQPSIVQPDFAHSTQESDLFDDNDGYYRTSDGYQWKYMYSIEQAIFDKFATDDFIPVIANSAVIAAAVDGAIDVIKVESGGSRYDNHFRSAFGPDDLRVSSNAAVLSSYSSDVLYSLGDNINIANVSGHAAVSASQSNVTGTSTTFTTDFQINDYVKVANSTTSEIKKIVSITNNTLMTISGNFTSAYSGANLAIAFPFDASNANDYYNDCVILIIAGEGVGQYQKIIDYVNDGVKKIAVLEEPFLINPDTTSRYEINPSVKVVGSGSETVNCVARAMVNTAAANSIYEIEILERGQFYKKAIANVLVSTVISIANSAILKPIISPFNGHGSFPSEELGATALGIAVKFANTESDSISVENDFKTIGVIKNPLFSNVELTLDRISDNNPGADGTFVANEKIYQISKLKLAGNVAVSSTSANVDGTGTNFDGLQVNDRVVISVGTNWYLSNVASVVNTTQITVSTNVSFSNTAASIYIAKVHSEGYVRSFESPALFVSNSQGFFEQNQQIIGLSSFATANIQNIAINDINKNDNFLTFSQLSYAEGSLNGAFEEDEEIWQGTSYANASFTARYHSIGDSDTKIFFTNTTGMLGVGVVHGRDSDATFTVTAKYNGDVIPGSGLPLYLQNGDEISRATNRTENIKIIVEY